MVIKNIICQQVSDLSFVMDTLPKLRFLDLSNNDVRDVPFGAFRGYPALERLYLASNQVIIIHSNNLKRLALE